MTVTVWCLFVAVQRIVGDSRNRLVCPSAIMLLKVGTMFQIIMNVTGTFFGLQNLPITISVMLKGCKLPLDLSREDAVKEALLESLAVFKEKNSNW